MSQRPLEIGVLAVQGDFEAHRRVLAASTDLGEPMRGDDIGQLAAEGELLPQRGW